MTDKNANTEIRKEFCPNCEADVPCTHEAELFVCDICGEDFAKYIVSRNANISDVSMTQDVLTDIKTPRSIENNNPDYYKQELARRNEERNALADENRMLSERIQRLVEGAKSRDEIIARLKEDAERLAKMHIIKYFDDAFECDICGHGYSKSPELIVHQPDCPITLHHALMKELEC